MSGTMRQASILRVSLAVAICMLFVWPRCEPGLAQQSSAQASQINLVRNPGFEVDSNHDGKPDNWKVSEQTCLDTTVFDDLLLVEDDSVKIGDVSPSAHKGLSLTQAEIERGYLVFTSSYMHRIYPSTMPSREEITDQLGCQAAPDEYEPVTLMVRALRNLEGLHLRLTGDLQGPDGAVIPAEGTVIRQVRPSSPLRSPGRPDRYALFLPKAIPADLAADTTRQYWVTIHVPEQTPPGVYSGRLLVESTNAARMAVALTVRVLPIKLLEPDVAFGMYYQLARIPEVYRDKHYQRLYYEDMKAHGMTSVTTYNCPVLTNDKVDMTKSCGGDYLPFAEEMELIQQVGLIAPGLPLLYLGSFAHGPNRPQDIMAVVAEQQRRGWPEFLWYVLDEPSELEAVKQAMKPFEDLPGSIRKASTVGPGEMGNYYDVLIMGVGFSERMVQLAEQQGKEPWLYACDMLLGNPITARYQNGLYTWKTGVKGNFRWVYTHYSSALVTPEGNWPDTDGWQWGYVLPGPNGPIPSIDWEAKREGIDDYRYICTLEDLIQRAAQATDEQTRAAARPARSLLRRLAARTTFEVTTFGSPIWPEMTPEQYDRYRHRIARQIVYLQGLLP